MENDIVWMLIALIGVFFLILWLVSFMLWLNDFKQTLKYINAEIERTEGRERRYWKRQKRKLWLSIIPFINSRD